MDDMKPQNYFDDNHDVNSKRVSHCSNFYVRFLIQSSKYVPKGVFLSMIFQGMEIPTFPHGMTVTGHHTLRGLSGLVSEAAKSKGTETVSGKGFQTVTSCWQSVKNRWVPVEEAMRVSQAHF